MWALQFLRPGDVAGSCNNLCDTAPDPAEFAARNAAHIKWMRETFAAARARRSVDARGHRLENLTRGNRTAVAAP